MSHDLQDAWRRHGETVGAVLERRAAIGEDAIFLHLLDDHGAETPLSYRDLCEGARRAAAALQARGVKPGDRVMMGLPTGRPFIELFFGALMAGATAVPFYPPARQKGLADYQAALARQIALADPAIVVTFARVRLAVEASAFQAGSRAPVVTPEALAGAGAFVPPPADPESTALIQFTSGSTSHPKGVMLTHRHLLANVAATLAMIRPGPGDVACSWLPLYHDMGLIGLLLMPLCSGTPLVLMSPQSFLMDVKRWLWAIHRHRCTISTAPNFAYQLVVNRLRDDEIEGLDLSCWKRAYNGAEPVLERTLTAFAERLAPYGFEASALNPIYGMAEVAVAAAFPAPGRGPRVDRIDAEALEDEGRAEPANGADRRTAAFVAVGPPLPGYRARVVGEDGAVLGDRRVGEIQLAGPSVMRGYLGDAEATAAALDGEWLRTGDLGYMSEGELFIVGRRKDMILKGGRNYAPQDLELLASHVAGVREGCVAAFGVTDPERGTERVVVLAETREHQERYPAIAKAIADRVGEGLGLVPDRVVMLPPGCLPKTSSGKIRRGQARERFLQDRLFSPADPGALEKTRLVGRAIAQRVTAMAPRKDAHA